MTERAIIRSSLFIDVSGLDDAWKILVRDANRRVGLSIFQQDIVERLVGFDKVVLLDEGIFIGWYHHIFDVLNLADKDLCLPILGGIIEVRTHTSFQVLGLAHINHCAIFIQVLIAPRFFCEAVHNHLQSLKSCFVFRHVASQFPMFLTSSITFVPRETIWR